jgi:hypothetical protein
MVNGTNPSGFFRQGTKFTCFGCVVGEGFFHHDVLSSFQGSFGVGEMGFVGGRYDHQFNAVIQQQVTEGPVCPDPWIACCRIVCGSLDNGIKGESGKGRQEWRMESPRGYPETDDCCADGLERICGHK